MDFINTLSKYYAFHRDIRSAERFYVEIVDRYDKVANLLGINVKVRKFSMLNTAFSIAVIIHVMYAYTFITSMYYYRDDIGKILLNITTIGLSIQMMAKLYLFVFHRKRIIDIREINIRYFEQDYFDSKTVKEALVQNARLTYIVLQLAAMFSIAMAILLVIPLFLYSVITSDKVLLFGFEWNHANTWTAYSINYLFQIVTLFYVTLATISSDAIFIVFLLTGCGQIDAIGAMLQDMSSMIEDGASEQEVTKKLEKIIKLHQHLILYMTEVEDSFNGYFLASMGALSSVMIISLFAFILIKWFMGVMIILFATSQLFYACFFGTFWKIKSDQLLLRIWFFNWYKLSPRNQKSFLLMLKAAQAPLDLTTIFVPLDMSAYLSIHKTLYSVCMLLVQATG